MRISSISQALAFVAVLATGCRSEPVGPGPRTFEGTFVLETVSGMALPAVVSEGPAERHTILADTLAFASDRTVVLSMTVTVDRQGGVPSETYTNRYTFAYELEGSRVRFGNLKSCGPAALCLLGFSEGDFTPTGLSVADHIFWRPGVMIYRRLPTG